jgi:hypothetical protein
MKKKHKILLLTLLLLAVIYASYRGVKKINPNPKFTVGQKLDSLNGVYVYYNGGVDNVEDRNLTADGYNLGLKYQCVEFAKRYYYEYYHHKMPDSYGHAKDFFDPLVKDGAMNKKRKLLQFINAGGARPRVGDLLIFDGHSANPYGHVAIVSAVYEKEIELIQQNPGPFASPRARLGLSFVNGVYTIESGRLLGWLRGKIETC